MRRVVVLPTILILWLGLIGPIYATDPDVIVTANTAPGSAPDVPNLLFGHNIRWVDDGEFLWDTTNHCVNSAALDVLQQAAKKPATLRFPGGHWADKVRWRRAVGPLDKRPELNSAGMAQKFGTDEVAIFANGMHSGMKPLMQVNWMLRGKPWRQVCSFLHVLPGGLNKLVTLA